MQPIKKRSVTVYILPFTWKVSFVDCSDSILSSKVLVVESFENSLHVTHREIKSHVKFYLQLIIYNINTNKTFITLTLKRLRTQF